MKYKCKNSILSNKRKHEIIEKIIFYFFSIICFISIFMMEKFANEMYDPTKYSCIKPEYIKYFEDTEYEYNPMINASGMRGATKMILIVFLFSSFTISIAAIIVYYILNLIFSTNLCEEKVFFIGKIKVFVFAFICLSLLLYLSISKAFIKIDGYYPLSVAIFRYFKFKIVGIGYE